MSWLIRYDDLDDEQQSIIDNLETWLQTQNIWVRGFPGSGKSIVLVFAIQKILNSHAGASIALVVFTRSLIEMFKAALKELDIRTTDRIYGGNDSGLVRIMTYYEFVKYPKNYDYVFADEVQDFVPRVLNGITSHTMNIVVAGDENQSIYEKDPQYHLPTATTTEINDVLSTEGKHLTTIHRLPRSVVSGINWLMPNMNIVLGGKLDATKTDARIRVMKAPNFREEISYVIRQAERAVNAGYTAAILLPTQGVVQDFFNLLTDIKGVNKWTIELNDWKRPNYGLLNSYLNSKSISFMYVGNGYGELDERCHKVFVLTYHSSKGLDFDNVFMPGLSNDLYIVPDPMRSKVLFMVASTRVRSNLYLTYSGNANNYVNTFARIGINAIQVIAPPPDHSTHYVEDLTNLPYDSDDLPF